MEVCALLDTGSTHRNWIQPEVVANLRASKKIRKLSEKIKSDTALGVAETDSVVELTFRCNKRSITEEFCLLPPNNSLDERVILGYKLLQKEEIVKFDKDRFLVITEAKKLSKSKGKPFNKLQLV